MKSLHKQIDRGIQNKVNDKLRLNAKFFYQIMCGIICENLKNEIPKKRNQIFKKVRDEFAKR
jgi:hypothetical protein